MQHSNNENTFNVRVAPHVSSIPGTSAAAQCTAIMHDEHNQHAQEPLGTVTNRAPRAPRALNLRGVQILTANEYQQVTLAAYLTCFSVPFLGRFPNEFLSTVLYHRACKWYVTAYQRGIEKWYVTAYQRGIEKWYVTAYQRGIEKYTNWFKCLEPISLC